MYLNIFQSISKERKGLLFFTKFEEKFSKVCTLSLWKETAEFEKESWKLKYWHRDCEVYSVADYLCRIRSWKATFWNNGSTWKLRYLWELRTMWCNKATSPRQLLSAFLLHLALLKRKCNRNGLFRIALVYRVSHTHHLTFEKI